MVEAIFTNIVHILPATLPLGHFRSASVCMGNFCQMCVCVFALEREKYCRNSEAVIKVPHTESWLLNTVHTPVFTATPWKTHIHQ